MGCGKVGYEVVTRIISCLSKRKAIDKELSLWMGVPNRKLL